MATEIRLTEDNWLKMSLGLRVLFKHNSLSCVVLNSIIRATYYNNSWHSKDVIKALENNQIEHSVHMIDYEEERNVHENIHNSKYISVNYLYK